MVGIYTVYAFIRRKTDAVFWGYVYLLLCLITSLLPILLGYGSANAITSLVWNIIWGIYFILSDNVKTLIPKETRTVGRIDWILAAIGVVGNTFCYDFYYEQFEIISQSWYEILLCALGRIT